MAFYRTCPLCGCNLDPGEKCDCETEKKKQEDFYRSMFRTSKSGQMAFVLDSKEVGYARKAAY